MPRAWDKKKCESTAGIEPMTLRTPVGGLNHWGTKDSWQVTAVGHMQGSFLLLVRHWGNELWFFFNYNYFILLFHVKSWSQTDVLEVTIELYWYILYSCLFTSQRYREEVWRRCCAGEGYIPPIFPAVNRIREETLHVCCIVCLFSFLLRKVFDRLLRLSPLLKKLSDSCFNRDTDSLVY